MNRYYPIAAPDRDLTINGTPIRHIYDADRVWVHNADLADAIGALAKGSLLTGVSAKWKRKWREDLGGGKAARAATYLVTEGLLQRSISMKRDSDSYPRLREAIDQIRTIEAERRTQHAEALTTAVPAAAPKDEPTLPMTLTEPPALADEAAEVPQESAEVLDRVEEAMKSLAPFTPAALRNANLGKRQRQVRERMSQIQHLLDLMYEDLVDAAIEKDITN
ncbi:hypothetical protein [uncultured Rothia sp.]|uniref:hypothetical protein n=1 Tax=uncultured Rothia sp. TaxID=316088 RepID=UPI002605C94B|nr:hypothetical protein [uncultured Rothia sp.]